VTLLLEHRQGARAERDLAALAKRKRLAINALADFAGVSRSQLYDVLATRKGASIDWLAKVATALEIQPWELLAPPRARTASSRSTG
jgi:lambda repressor-like predicted transcriptional regulator